MKIKSYIALQLIFRFFAQARTNTCDMRVRNRSDHHQLKQKI